MQNRIATIAGGLPKGTLAVGAGLAVLGLASYLHLAIAGHTLDQSAMSSLSVLWSIVFAIGPGLFFPVEQEITRVVARHRAHGTGYGPVVRRGALLALGVLSALLVICFAAAQPLADTLFDGDIAMVWVLCGAFAALAMAHTTRGVLAGLGRLGVYGAQLGVDGALRIAIAVILGLTHTDSAVWFGLVLVIAPIASVIVTSGPLRKVFGPGEAVAWPALLSGLGLLTISTVLAQVMVNIAVVDAKLLDPADTAATAALLSAVVLVRVPLFLFASLQAALLPGLSTAIATGDRAAYRGLLRRTLAVVTGLGVLGGLISIAIGPYLIGLLFNAPDVMSRMDFAWLALGTTAYLWALVLGQGLLAQGRHRDQALGWVVGTVVLAAVTAVPLGVLLRVELAYALGALATAATLYLLLVRKTRAPAPHPIGAP